jgi:hypothetical protein
VRLAELQKRFVASAYGRIDPRLAAAVRGGGRLSSADAVGVYRSGYPARLSEALGETFEACWRVLGDADFLAACAEFARKVPSTSHNLSDYGAKFPAFLLGKFKGEAPYIGELGRLEWEYKELFHKAPHQSLRADLLAKQAKPDSVLNIGTATALLTLKYSVLNIWKRDRTDERRIDPAEWNTKQHVILFKHGGNDVKHAILSRPEVLTLQSLRAGKKVLNAFASGMDESRTRKLFAFLAENGLVESVS